MGLFMTEKLFGFGKKTVRHSTYTPISSFEAHTLSQEKFPARAEADLSQAELSWWGFPRLPGQA